MPTDNSRAEFLPRHKKEIITGTTFCRVFRDTAEAYPDDMAVTAGGRAVTYRELSLITEAAARKLIKQGVRPGGIVAISSGRSIESIAAMLASWKVGCAYVYLDRSYPDDRKRKVVDECHCAAVLDKEWWKDLPNVSDGKWTDESINDGIAVIVYTSGSTSYPKGVMVTHRNVLAVMYSFELFGTKRGTHYGVFPGLGFVASVCDIFSSLAVGARLCIVPRCIRKNIRAIADYYREYGVEISFLPPHMARKLLALDIEDLPLKLLLVGSEPVRNLGHREDGSSVPFEILNVYGASEACSLISCYKITESMDLDIAPVGKLVPGLYGWLVKDDGTLAKRGEEGELWLAGNQVTRGYFHDPERTAKSYVKNPYSDDPNLATALRTNDILVELPDGNMRYVCRKDNVLKVRGFRVENTSVEQVMFECAPIRDAAVVAFMDKGGCNILCGYFTSDEEIDVKAFKERMKKIVPYYMVPTCLIRIDKMPRTANGKTDRKALKPPKELNNHKLLEILY